MTYAPFHEEPNTAVITCCHILDENKPILFVSHDKDDGGWQFLCGGQHAVQEARLVSLVEIYKCDNTLGQLAEIPCDYYAERKSKDDHWTVKKRGQ